jgi:hypothetical protein
MGLYLPQVFSCNEILEVGGLGVSTDSVEPQRCQWDSRVEHWAVIYFAQEQGGRCSVVEWLGGSSQTGWHRPTAADSRDRQSDRRRQAVTRGESLETLVSARWGRWSVGALVSPPERPCQPWILADRWVRCRHNESSLSLTTRFSFVGQRRLGTSGPLGQGGSVELVGVIHKCR